MKKNNIHASCPGFACLPVLVAVFAFPFVITSVRAQSEERNYNSYPPDITHYFQSLYDIKRQALRFRPDYPGGFSAWRKEARRQLPGKLGLDKIAAYVGDYTPSVKLGDPIDCGTYTRQRGTMETEPGMYIPFWLLKPKTEGPWPLGLFPHGHDSMGEDTTAGVYANEEHKKKSLAEDGDVAVQAVSLGFLAIAPATRGLSSSVVIPDIYDRHGGRLCRSQLMHALLVGRTAIGERVWDMQRLLDWAIRLPGVNPKQVLMMGNSGGGLVTMFTAACDERVGIGVVSAAFNSKASESGYIYHCDCSMIPGLLELYDLTDVAGMIAPRYLLAVNGVKDFFHPVYAVEQAAVHTHDIYQASGSPDHFQLLWGAGGHHFHKDLMWPFVTNALAHLETDAPVEKESFFSRFHW